MDYLLGAALGGLIAFILSIPAIIVEVADRKHKFNLPLLVDVREIFGKKISQPEMFWIALFAHLLIGCLFGLVYPVFVVNEWLYITHQPYTFVSLFFYALHAWLVVMLIIFPIIGFGLFARREGKLVWLEVLITMILIGVFIQLAIDWFRPFYFAIPG